MNTPIILNIDIKPNLNSGNNENKGNPHLAPPLYILGIYCFHEG